MGSELDLDDAIASILADSDEDNVLTKKKKPSSKKKQGHNKTRKSLSSKALTSSVSEEDFNKNISKIVEESSKDENADDVVVTEEDAKKMASDLAGLDDLDSDLLGSLGRKGKVLSPRNKPAKDHDVDKNKEPKRKTSSGSLHRKGSVTPSKDDDDDDNVKLSDDDSEDALNSSMNSTRSRHRKSGGSKKTPNKISPRFSFDDAETDTKPKKSEQLKSSKSKEINFDSDSDLPGLENDADHSSDEVTKKPARNKKGRKKKGKEDGDLFGDDDDLPDLDGKPKNKERRSETSSKKASSALDNLLGSKQKTSSQESKKKPPASLDEFMAKVSTTGKPSNKSDVQSPVRSPNTEETFQFGGYMPSAAAGSGRRSRISRPDSASEFGRRSVKFSDDLGLDDDLFGTKKRPSTAPQGGRKKRDEHASSDPLNNTFSGQLSKDKNDLLDLSAKDEENNSKKHLRAGKVDGLSPQSSLQGSKSSTSGDWLGLGDDVTDDQLNVSPAGSIGVNREKSPERSMLTSPREKPVEKKHDDELSKMLDMVPDINNNSIVNDDKSLFPWEGGQSFARRRRPGTASPLKQESQEIAHGEMETEKKGDQGLKSGSDAGALPETRTNSSKELSLSDGHSNMFSDQPSPMESAVIKTDAQRRTLPEQHLTKPSHLQQHKEEVLPKPVPVEPSPVYHEVQYRSELEKQRKENDVELRGMMGKVQELEKAKHTVELQLANKVAELETKVRRLEVENESLVQTLELTKQRHRDEMSALENSHKVRIQAVEESYQRREARQKEESELLLIKHRDTVRQIETEKSDIESANARKISTYESNKLSEIERLNDLHRRAMDELRSEHTVEMNHLKKMKEQEVSATITAYSHTKSLQSLMEQVLNSTKQVDDLHHLVEVSHKTSQQERDIAAKAKEEYVNQLHDRLLKQQAENEEERTRLQSLVAKMEVHVREQNRRLEEDKWKLSQEDSKLKSMRASLEEERRITREQLEHERAQLQRSKDEFLTQQRRMMVDINEERKTLSLERAELSAAQRGIFTTEKQKQETFTKMDAEHESARIRLVEDTTALNAKESQIRKEQEELRRQRRELMEKQEKWESEKERIGKLGLELEKRAQDIEELSLDAARVREDGLKSLEIAQRMQVDVARKANELESKVSLVQEKERQIAEERLAIVKEKRELELVKRRGLCSRCSQSPHFTKMDDSNEKFESSPKHLFSLAPSPSSAHRPAAEPVSSPTVTPALPLTPDLLINTLDLKRTLRRWSLDKEQDEEFLAKESEFLSNLHESRQLSKSLSRSQYSAIS